MAGDPDVETALQILSGLPAAGADIIEVGFPFSDPMAEGPPIQQARQRALAAGMTLNGVLALVRRFRDGDQTTPDRADGLHERAPDSRAGRLRAGTRPRRALTGSSSSIARRKRPIRWPTRSTRLASALIRLATPTSDDARLKVIARRTAGFVYYVSVAGVTGVKAVDEAGVGPAVERVRRATGLPVAVGFGIRTPEQAAAVAARRRRRRRRLGARRRGRIRRGGERKCDIKSSGNGRATGPGCARGRPERCRRKAGMA